MAELDRQVLATLELFTASYPVFAQGKPLAIGTREKLIERHPDIDARLLRSALLKHCKRPRYLKALAAEPQRYDLDGNPMGVVTDEEREKAKTDLEKHHEHEDAVQQRRLAEEQRQMEAAQRKAERIRLAKMPRPTKRGRAKPAASASAAAPKTRSGEGARQPVIIIKKRPRPHGRDGSL